MTNDAVDVGGDRFRQNDEQRRHFQRRFQTGGLVNDGTAVCTAEIRVADDAVYFPTTVSGVMINSEACFRAALTYSARLVRGLPSAAASSG